MQEKTIQTKTCKHCNSNFEITDKDLEFYNKVSPVFGWKKYQIPTPNLCPDCRQQRRLSFRNERNLYKRDCNASGREIISMYSPDKKYKIYSQEEWWSDNWNAFDYWVDFDFNKNFFEQLDDIFCTIPLLNLFLVNSENSNYCNYSNDLGNCYLCYGCWYSNESYYMDISRKSENCIDCSYCASSINSYECIDSTNITSSYYSVWCVNCHDIFYCYSCIWCENCFFSTNLVNKKYHIFNKEYSKEKYFLKLKEIQKNKDKYIIKYNNLLANTVRSNLVIIWSDNCFWNVLFSSKNSYHCYDSLELENCKYITNCGSATECFDGYWVYYWSELSYNLVNTGWYKSLFCISCSKITNCLYCIDCHWCTDCFWCIWLRNKQYCIFNKQYTKEEYEKLVPKIIEHMQKIWEWWEFFPSSISPFWYNETVAQEYFLLTKEDAKNKWFNWSDYESPKPNVEKIIPAEKLPENIKDIPDDILNWAIKCEVTWKPFRIIKQELDFYRKHNLPIPRKHPDQRHLKRMQLRNPRKLFNRKCDKCWIEMKTTYSPDRKEIVYCEKCYREEIY